MKKLGWIDGKARARDHAKDVADTQVLDTMRRLRACRVILKDAHISSRECRLMLLSVEDALAPVERRVKERRLMDFERDR
jgi:hypothetical protein